MHPTSAKQFSQQANLEQQPALISSIGVAHAKHAACSPLSEGLQGEAGSGAPSGASTLQLAGHLPTIRIEPAAKLADDKEIAPASSVTSPTTPQPLQAAYNLPPHQLRYSPADHPMQSTSCPATPLQGNYSVDAHQAAPRSVASSYDGDSAADQVERSSLSASKERVRSQAQRMPPRPPPRKASSFFGVFKPDAADHMRHSSANRRRSDDGGSGQGRGSQAKVPPPADLLEKMDELWRA